MSLDAKQKVDELFTLYENEFKSAAKEAKAEAKKFGEESAEVKSKIEKMQERMDTLEKEASDILAQVKKSGEDAGKSEADRYSELFVKKHFSRKLTRAEASEYAELESKAMQSDIAEDGGILLPENMERRVIEKVYETSPILELATTFTISEGDQLIIPVETDDFSIGGWANNERYTVSESNTGKLKEVNIPVHELWAEPRVTQKMLEDSAINVEQYINRKVQDVMRRRINTAAVSGSGVNEPQGFLTGLPSAQIVNSGSTTAFDADDLIILEASLKSEYADNAVWGFKRLTRAYIRKFTAADDNYLWQPGLQAGAPALLLGHRYVMMDDLATFTVSSGNFAANDIPVVFADWSRFYGIVRRRGMRLVKDELTSKPYVKYWFSTRIGGKRLLDEAGVVLRTA